MGYLAGIRFFAKPFGIWYDKEINRTIIVRLEIYSEKGIRGWNAKTIFSNGSVAGRLL
jgi:hypothetical protein